MEIYFFVIVSMWLLAFTLIIYLKKISLEDYKYTLVITTHNCADICEGVVRIALWFAKKMGNYQIVVVDMHSNDETYEILKKLSLKYFFPLFRRTQKQFDNYNDLVDIDIATKYRLLVLNQDSTYYKASADINRMRHSSTYNTSFH